MLLKALLLANFESALLLKWRMIISVKKTLNTFVKSVQNRSISSEICPENSQEIGRFVLTVFR